MDRETEKMTSVVKNHPWLEQTNQHQLLGKDIIQEKNPWWLEQTNQLLVRDIMISLGCEDGAKGDTTDLCSSVLLTNGVKTEKDFRMTLIDGAKAAQLKRSREDEEVFQKTAVAILEGWRNCMEINVRGRFNTSNFIARIPLESDCPEDIWLRVQKMVREAIGDEGLRIQSVDLTYRGGNRCCEIYYSI